MDTVISYFTNYTIVDLFAVIALLIVCVRGIERFLKWVFSFKDFLFKKLGIETKKMREEREWKERLEKAEKDIEEIKNTSKRNVDMFLDHEKQVVERFTDIKDEIISELNKLQLEVEKQQKENDETDRAMLRKMIKDEMRELRKNTDTQGNVHISLGDYQTLGGMFQKYFKKHGNGAFEKYFKEFKNFIIDD